MLTVSPEANPPNQGLVDKFTEIAPRECDVHVIVNPQKRPRNLISKFPNEVLSEIFVFAKATPLRIGRTRRGGWLNIASVCRRWRGVALNTPRLWDEIDTSYIKTLERASTVLARSKAVPLFVKHPGLQREQAILDMILSSVARIQELDIEADQYTLQQLFTTNRGDAPMIRSLRLCNTTLESEYSDTVMMLSQVFSIQMPSLQTLILLDVDLPSTIPLLPQLRRLVVITKSPSMSPLLLLSTLRSTPSLEELEFQHRPSELPTQGMGNYPTVELPTLSLLSLKASSYDISGVFQYIHYPPSTRVIFESDTHTPDPQSVAAVVAHFASADIAAEVDEVFISDSPTELRLRASVGGVTSLDVRSHLSAPVRVEFFRMGTLIPSANVKTLRLTGYGLIERAEWMDLFDHYEHVLEVKLPNAGEDFVDLLMKYPTDERVPLPNLEILTLGDTVIDRRFCWDVEGLVVQRRGFVAPPGLFRLRGDDCLVHLRSSHDIQQGVSFDWDSADVTLERLLEELVGLSDEDKWSQYSQDQSYDDEYDFDDSPLHLPWDMGLGW